MFDPPTMARSALDQALGGEPIGERSERLITLEGLNGQFMGRGPWHPTDDAQSIPLGERRSHSCKPGIERPMVLVLHLLDSSAQRHQVNSHTNILSSD